MQLPCLPKRRRPRTPRSIAPWRAICAAAAAISAFTRRFAPPPRGRNMTHHDRMSGLIIHNVSRRNMLKGIASVGGLVLAAQIPGMRAALAYPTGADAMPNGVRTDPHLFVSIAKDGTVTIVAARAGKGTGASPNTLPVISADQLETNIHRVQNGQGEGDEKKYGNQD